MYQFFVEDSQVSENVVFIEGSDAGHIRRVLRMKAGEKVRVSTSSGKNYYCAIAETTEQMVRADILEECAEGTELPCRIYLFQGLPKSDKMELIIQKSVELGVYEIIPVAMKNCVAKLDEKKAEGRVARWQEIAKSAAKQSKRSLIPSVRMPMGYADAVKLAEELDVALIPYENERGMTATRETIEAIRPGQNIGIFIGPEGGFSEREIALADACGMQRISLGKRILRTETAGLATLAILMYQMESRTEHVRST